MKTSQSLEMKAVQRATPPCLQTCLSLASRVQRFAKLAMMMASSMPRIAVYSAKRAIPSRLKVQIIVLLHVEKAILNLSSTTCQLVANVIRSVKPVPALGTSAPHAHKRIHF